MYIQFIIQINLIIRNFKLFCKKDYKKNKINNIFINNNNNKYNSLNYKIKNIFKFNIKLVV